MAIAGLGRKFIFSVLSRIDDAIIDAVDVCRVSRWPILQLLLVVGVEDDHDSFWSARCR